MKRRILSITLALVTACTVSFAQLSERENDATMVKLGARPQSGNLALTFGYNLGGAIDDNEADASLFTGNFFAQGDFLTFKYYQSDDLAIRFAIRLSKHSNKYKGDALRDSSFYYNISAPTETETKVKYGSREYVFVPGIEKHFSTSNIFDVYMGADLYLGFGKEDSTNEWAQSDGDFYKYSHKKSSTIIGIGGIVGFNIFVAHLPISIGLEYGLNLKWTLGGRYKVKESHQVGTKSYDTEYQTVDQPVGGNNPGAPAQTRYTKLKKSQFDMDTNQDVRLVLNIYFAQ